MIYQSKDDHQANSARVKLEFFIKQGKAFELKEKRITRTIRQNAAMHKFFEIVSNELNDLGIEFTYNGLATKSISMMYTPELVKNFFWRPIQMALFDIKSTVDLDTHQMNSVIDIITKFFGEKGVYVEFPNRNQLLSEEAENVNKHP